jgi:hypothetical protein
VAEGSSGVEDLLKSKTLVHEVAEEQISPSLALEQRAGSALSFFEKSCRKKDREERAQSP